MKPPPQNPRVNLIGQNTCLMRTTGNAVDRSATLQIRCATASSRDYDRLELVGLSVGKLLLYNAEVGRGQAIRLNPHRIKASTRIPTEDIGTSRLYTLCTVGSCLDIRKEEWFKVKVKVDGSLITVRCNIPARFATWPHS
jgi:hypothetical protein